MVMQLSSTRGKRERNKVNNSSYNFTTICDVNNVGFVIGYFVSGSFGGGARVCMIKY